MKERNVLVLDLPKTWVSTTSDLSDKEFKIKWLLKYKQQNVTLKDDISKSTKHLQKRFA